MNIKGRKTNKELKETVAKKSHRDHNTSTKSDSQIVKIIFKSLILDLLAFTMILPLLPAILEFYKTFDGSEGWYSWIMDEIKILQVILNAPDQFTSVLFGGFLGSMYSFLQFLGMPIFGGLSDVYGRKPMMIICLSGISISYLIWILSRNFGIFILARFIGGLSKGNISLSMAIITDVTTPQTRGKSMALIGIAFSIGFLAGPMIGVVFFKISSSYTNNLWYIYPATFAFLLSIMNLFYFIYCFEETLPVQKRTDSFAKGISGVLEYINPIDLFQFNAVKGLNLPELASLRTLGFVYFFYLFIYSGLEFTLTFLTHHSFKFTSIEQGYMFLMIGLTMAIFQGAFVRRIPADKTILCVKFGLWSIIFAFVIIGLAQTVVFLYIGIFIFSVSTAVTVTCMMTIVSEIGPQNQKGIIAGIFRSLGAFARACGPAIASIAFWIFGSTSTYLFGAFLLIVPPLLLQTMHIR